MPPGGPVIEVVDLVKTYGATRAVDGLSFSVASGEVFALLGPNGAGKTTTVEIMEGLKRPDGGSVRVLGLDPVRDHSALAARTGTMLQGGGLYPGITPREALRLFARYYADPCSPEELIRLVGLEPAASTRYRRLSGGQRQRLALALALVGRPRLVFLDEPTSGLDPQARRAAWDLVRDLRAQQVTVVLTTHYLDEAERLADRVAVIDAGKLLVCGNPAELVRQDSSIVRLRTVTPVPPQILTSLPAAGDVRSDGTTYIVSTTDASELLAQMAVRLRDEGIPIRDLRVGRASLEDLYFELTGKEFEDGSRSSDSRDPGPDGG